jgi:hypothetical protein
VSDFVTRISPGMESKYRSTRTRLRGRYTLDVERFARQDALTTADGRHAALCDVRYSQSRAVIDTLGAVPPFFCTALANVVSGFSRTARRERGANPR